MRFQLNFKSGKPVYLQMVDQVKAATASGAARAGEPLPSIRPLAEELRVNRNTVAKAYAELESQGVIETVAGKGCFVRANKTPFNAEFQDLITRYLWGIWTRPHFDVRTRRVLVIGTLMALGHWEEFRTHVRAALVEGGFSADDIKEIILQQAIYCGAPAGNRIIVFSYHELTP